MKCHQSRTDSSHLACNRAKKIREKEESKELDRNKAQLISEVKFYSNEPLPDVSHGPHPKGSPISAGQKKCILNLFQSYLNDGMTRQQARFETATRLQFSEKSVTSIVKEKIAIGEVSDNTKNRILCNAYEKLADEEIEDIRKLVSTILLVKSFFPKIMAQTNEKFVMF